MAVTGAAFAQSTVTVSGLIDTGFLSQNAPKTSAGVAAKTSGLAANNSATTVLTFAGTEDLGGGLRASFQLQLTPDFVSGNGVGGASATNIGTGQQAFVGLSGGFGSVQLGRVNSPSLGAWGVGSVLGTNTGSGYGAAGNIYTRYSASAGAATTSNHSAPTRFNRAISYTSPNINGLTATVLYVPSVSGNDPTTSNQQGVTDIGLRYAAGPLNIAYAQQTIKQTGTVDVGNQVLGAGAAVLVDGKKNTLSTLSANYNMGDITVYGAYWTEKQDTSTPVDVSGNMIGVKYTMGAISLMASTGTSNDNTSASGVDKKITGIGADYAMSKRTSLYFRMDTRDANTNSTTDNAANGTTKRTAIGVRHSF